MQRKNYTDRRSCNSRRVVDEMWMRSRKTGEGRWEFFRSTRPDFPGAVTNRAKKAHSRQVSFSRRIVVVPSCFLSPTDRGSCRRVSGTRCKYPGCGHLYGAREKLKRVEAIRVEHEIELRESNERCSQPNVQLCSEYRTSEQRPREVCRMFLSATSI